MSPDNRASVGIVIVNHQSETQLEACLSSLSKIDYHHYQILVVDNSNSLLSRNKLEKLEEKFNISVIFSPENKGFAAACNIGIVNFRKRGFEYIWLLNPDLVVAASALSALVKGAAFYNNQVLFGSKVLFGSLNLEKALADISKQEIKFNIWSAGGKIDFSKLQIDMIGHGENDLGQYNLEKDCDYLPACSLFFHISIIDLIGYLPEEYFLYFEETDWCTRAKKSALNLKYLPRSVVWHCFDTKKLQTPNTVYYYNRNNLYFWSKYSNRKLKLKISVLLKRFPLALLAYLREREDRRKELLFSQLLAYLDFLFGKMGQRRRIGFI